VLGIEVEHARHDRATDDGVDGDHGASGNNPGGPVSIRAFPEQARSRSVYQRRSADA
jgi:hypothetical protein